MKIVIDTDKQTLEKLQNGSSENLPLYGRESFEILTGLWLKNGWNNKFSYQYTWLGRPVIQMPEDLLRIQELIYSIKPDVIIETGVAHGGSLIFYASLCKMLEKGQVIGVDIDIREHNKEAIRHHKLSDVIHLIEGNSVATQIINKVKSFIKPDDTVLVILDSCHTSEHVKIELETYAPLVSNGSYLIVADGIMADLYDTPNAETAWQENNPLSAISDFLDNNQEFRASIPRRLFDESDIATEVSYWNGGWLKKKR